MKFATVAQVKAGLSAYLKEARNGPVVVTKHGKPEAVLIHIDSEEELERVLISHSGVLNDILARSEQAYKEGRTIEHDEFWLKVGKG